MNNIKNIPIDLLNQIIEVYSKVGDKKINKVIENYYNWNFADFITRVTMAIVCKHFRISEEELLDGNSLKDGTRINALSIYVYLVRENVHLSNSKLRIYLHKKSCSAISKYVKIFNSYNEKIPEHKKVLLKLNLIKEELNEQINIYNNNSKR
jgi:hypothetical protein